jgi:two-component system sporulation sensor kinase A
MHTSGVVLNLDLEINLPWVLVDVNQMKQVLLNLVHNALQAMPSGGEMKILTETVSRNNRDWVVVAVMGCLLGWAGDRCSIGVCWFSLCSLNYQ